MPILFLDSGASLTGPLEVKPYALERWLYVDGIDVSADHRRKGAGTAILRKLIEFAKDANCVEIWIGTEEGNQAANALYR